MPDVKWMTMFKLANNWFAKCIRQILSSSSSTSSHLKSSSLLVEMPLSWWYICRFHSFSFSLYLWCLCCLPYVSMQQGIAFTMHDLHIHWTYGNCHCFILGVIRAAAQSIKVYLPKLPSGNLNYKRPASWKLQTVHCTFSFVFILNNSE